MEQAPRETVDPTPAQIELLTAVIRSTWTDEQRAKRAGVEEQPWLPPRFADVCVGVDAEAT